MRVLLLGVILSLLVVMPGALHGLPAAHAAFRGDFNCDGSVDTQDVITVLAVSSGVQPLSSCSNAVSVECDGDTDVTDALVLLHYLAATSVSLSAGCSDINTLIPGTSPQDAADQLLARITGGGSLPDVIDGVQEALARGGVPTGDGLGTTYTPAFEPSSPSVAIPLEELDLALEARGAGSVYRMDAVQLGQMLSDFGWPFFTDSTPGAQIVAMLQELVTGAQALPNDPNSFTPLFLQAMGKIQDPAVDLSAGDAAPENVHFNLLELRLLVAMFERQTVYPNQPASELVEPAADDPCTEAKAVLSGVAGPFAGTTTGLLTNEAGPTFIEQGLHKAGATSHTAEKVGKALEALKIAAKIWKLIDFYSSTHVAVSIIDGSSHLHKPLDTAPDEKRTFDAVAGVSQEDWDAYQKANSDLGSEVSHAVRDCLNLIGLQVFSDLGDIVKDAEHWKVDWSISNNRDNSRGQKAITWDPGEQESGTPNLGNWRSDMIKTSDHSYEGAFIVDIGTETAADHLGSPLVKIDDVYVCGAVFSAEPPEAQTFVDAVKGPLGLTVAIADLGAGWLRTVAEPESCRTLTVVWHEPCPLANAGQPADAGSISIEALTSISQLPCTWTGTAHGKTHYYSGTLYDEVGTIDETFTFGNPKVDENGDQVIYNIISGSATWQASGHYGSCTFSKSGTEKIQAADLFIVSGGGSGQLTYVGSVHTDGQDVSIPCAYSDPFFIETEGIDIGFCPGSGLVTGLDLSGSCIHDQPGEHTEFSWNLSGISCSAAVEALPQGTCGGAVSGLPNP
jgi:hypothetical protein